MTNRDSHIIFKVLLDKNAQGIAFGGAPAFLEEEIDIFLNQAQLEILSNKITGVNYRKAAMEQDYTNMSEINKLMKTDKQLKAYKTEYNEFQLDELHDNERRLVITQVQLRLGTQLTNCGIVQHQYAKLFKQTYNNVPWVENPIGTMENDTLLLYVDPIMMLDPLYKPLTDEGSKDYYLVDLTYISKPTEFDYTKPDDVLDFAEDVMNEIVNRAVVLALDNIESARWQSKLSLNNLQE